MSRHTAGQGIGALYALLDLDGGHSVIIERDESGNIEVRSRGRYATRQRRTVQADTISNALVKLAIREGVATEADYPDAGLEELALANDCDICGLPLEPDKPLDGHPECREQE